MIFPGLSAEAIAKIHIALGDRIAAIAELEKANLGRDSLMVFLKVQAKWDELRTEPGFIGLLPRMKFQ